VGFPQGLMSLRNTLMRCTFRSCSTISLLSMIYLPHTAEFQAIPSPANNPSTSLISSRSSAINHSPSSAGFRIQGVGALILFRLYPSPTIGRPLPMRRKGSGVVVEGTRMIWFVSARGLRNVGASPWSWLGQGVEESYRGWGEVCHGRPGWSWGARWGVSGVGGRP